MEIEKKELMLEWINKWPDDFFKGFNKKIRFNKEFDKILFWGMGGSGIGGRVLSDISNLYGKKVIIGGGGYNIPNWVDNETLFIPVSYSGNTEETITAYKKAREKNAEIVIVTAGGFLKEEAIKFNYPVIELQKGRAPRANIGEMIGVLLSVSVSAKFINFPKEKAEQIKSKLLEYLHSNEMKNNLKICDRIWDKNLYIISKENFAATAYRFACQLNENAKKTAISLTLPELDHNFIVGKLKSNDCLIFLNPTEFETQRDKKRRLSTIKVFKEKNIGIFTEDINFIESDYILNYLKILLFCDLLSFHISLKLDVNPHIIEPIIKLKEMMKEK